MCCDRNRYMPTRSHALLACGDHTAVRSSHCPSNTLRVNFFIWGKNVM